MIRKFCAGPTQNLMEALIYIMRKGSFVGGLGRLITVLPLLMTGAAPASAGLLGQNIDMTLELEFLGERWTNTVLVGAGPEIICPSGPFAMCGDQGLTSRNQSLDADDTSITYSYDGKDGVQSFLNFSSFVGFEFSKLNAGGNVVGPIVLTTNMAGMDMSRISSTDNLIRVRMNGLSIEGGSFFTVAFGAAEVPEPSTFGLLLVGLGAAVAARRFH